MFSRPSLLALFFAVGGPAIAQPNAAESSSALKITASIDTFYSLNLDHPSSDQNQFQNFDLNQGLELNAAEVTIEKAGPVFGFRLDTGYGEMFRVMNLPDPGGGINRYISQAYLSYKPLRHSNVQIDVGKFYTSAGAEGPETYNNFNYSRSLLFVLGEPYYHLGARATIPITKSFSAGAQLLNGWNDVGVNNTGKTAGFTSSFQRTKWTWAQAHLVGPEKTGTNTTFRHLYDSTLTLAPQSRLSGYLETVWGIDRKAAGGIDRWSGIAAAGRLSFAKKWSLNPRLERFNDGTGFATGVAEHLKAATATLDYRPFKLLLVRSEIRRDWSDRPCFERGAAPNSSKSQETVLLGLVFLFKTEY